MGKGRYRKEWGVEGVEQGVDGNRVWMEGGVQKGGVGWKGEVQIGGGGGRVWFRFSSSLHS